MVVWTTCEGRGRTSAGYAMAQAAEAYEVIEAKNDLRSKVREVRSKGPGDDPVARAEAALTVLSAQFDEWMASEIDDIGTSHAAWAATDYADGAAREAFFRAVHDLKGQAATLGFPLASKVAASLTGLLEGMPATAPLPVPLIEQHVAAIRAIFREKVKDETDEVGQELATALSAMTDDYLAIHGDPAADLFE